MEAKGTDSRTGWLVVAAAFLCTFTVMGVTYSFGATFSALQTEFDTASALTSMFFAITTFVYFTGRIADKFGPATVVRVGAVAMAAGLVLTSRVNSIWLGFITYGLGVGIGVACSYVPMVATVGAWFERDRTKALGVAVSGIGVGTLVGAPLATWRRIRMAHDLRHTRPGVLRALDNRIVRRQATTDRSGCGTASVAAAVDEQPDIRSALRIDAHHNHGPVRPLRLHRRLSR